MNITDSLLILMIETLIKTHELGDLTQQKNLLEVLKKINKDNQNSESVSPW